MAILTKNLQHSKLQLFWVHKISEVLFILRMPCFTDLKFLQHFSGRCIFQTDMSKFQLTPNWILKLICGFFMSFCMHVCMWVCVCFFLNIAEYYCRMSQLMILLYIARRIHSIPFVWVKALEQATEGSIHLLTLFYYNNFFLRSKFHWLHERVLYRATIEFN